MGHLVGVGALLEDDAFNLMRYEQLRASSKTHNIQALRQPPHITVKRPFAINVLSDIEKLENIVANAINDIASPFEVQFEGVSCFSTHTLFARVVPSDHLFKLHHGLLMALEKAFPASTASFEGSDMVFHSTISANLDERQFSQLQKQLKKGPDQFTTPALISKLGIFLNIDHSHWIVVRELRLG